MLALGCLHNPPPPVGEPATVVAAARNMGISLDDPLELDPADVHEVLEAVGGRGEPLERLKKLDEYLRGTGERSFRYAHGLHLDAQQALDQRRGDCLSYALLFGALSRKMGIRTRFMHASEVSLRFERGGAFYASSHVGVGYGTGPKAMVIDFSIGRVTSWHLTPYEPISDATVVALHYNNVAVARLAEGRVDEAEQLLAVLLEVEPRVPELYNNYGVVLKRRGRHAQALSVLDRGLRAFPTYPPMYTNAIHAAEAAGLPAVAAQLEARGRDVSERDPFFLFARGLFLYRKKSYGYAAEQFARAHGAQPDSPVILAWLTRAYAAAGDRQRAREAFSEARRLQPSGALVRELSLQFPDLLQ
jgi:tetratricopeptide (TPR) repeat protein